jgi:hypothetical protein
MYYQNLSVIFLLLTLMNYSLNLVDGGKIFYETYAKIHTPSRHRR